MAYTSLYVYYKTNFGLAQHHKWSIDEIEKMVPYERDLYVGLLTEFLEEEKEKRRANDR
jgi:hypothetical protein